MKTQYCKDCKWKTVTNYKNPCSICKDYDCFEFEEKSDREKAIEWWNALTELQKAVLYMNYFGCKSTDQFPDEIEQIWRRETQQELERGIVITREKRPQVDFEMLNSNLMYVTEHCKYSSSDKLRAREVTKNLLLFFELLSKSSTFAHKAHISLKTLNK